MIGQLPAIFQSGQHFDQAFTEATKTKTAFYQQPNKFHATAYCQAIRNLCQLFKDATDQLPKVIERFPAQRNNLETLGSSVNHLSSCLQPLITIVENEYIERTSKEPVHSHPLLSAQNLWIGQAFLAVVNTLAAIKEGKKVDVEKVEFKEDNNNATK